jgi:hypothetical protein
VGVEVCCCYAAMWHVGAEVDLSWPATWHVGAEVDLSWPATWHVGGTHMSGRCSGGAYMAEVDQ